MPKKVGTRMWEAEAPPKDPELRELRERGFSKKDALRLTGRHPLGGHLAYFGCIDPTPQPLGVPYGAARYNETPEMRAFRRFPISSHKPGPA